MEDQNIVSLYWARKESAIAETSSKYGKYLYRISYQILTDSQDAEECVNDTYRDAWNSMPPHRPALLSTFLGKITRRISIDRWRQRHAEKRGGGELCLVLDELEECIDNSSDVETVLEQQEMTQIMENYLSSLSVTERRVFLRRYWYMDSIAAISADFGFSVSKTTSLLHRVRQKLRKKLESEGYL